MNFWPRGTFLPTVAASVPFQAVPLNNPAWAAPQPVVTAPFFAHGLAAAAATLNPWAMGEAPVPPDMKPEPSGIGERQSPWLHQQGDNSRSDRYDRRGSRDRSRDRSRERGRSRERSRRRRSRSRSRSRDRRSVERSVSPRGRSRDGRSRRDDDRRERDSERRRDRSPDRREYGRNSSYERDDNRRKPKEDERKKEEEKGDDKYSLEAANYKTQTPNETIMIRGLAQHITENDIRKSILQCNLNPKDIRLIRKKETGVSRGFAFVEFNSTEEALCWMDMKQGVLMLQQYRAIMQFSIVAGDAGFTNAPFPPADWDCHKCYAHNFKKRITCFKCMAARPDSDPKHPNNEISPHPTTKIMIRNLDPLTTEEVLLKEISAVSNIAIQSCQISRDPLTTLSRGASYLEMKNVLEAINLYNELTSKEFIVQGRKVMIYYCKLQTDPVSVTSEEVPTTYSLSDVPRLAEYSARVYSTNPSQKSALIQYYTQYYTNQIKQIAADGGTKDVNSAAAVALSAMQMAQAKKAVLAGAAASALSAAAALNNQQTTPATQNSYGYMSSQQIIGNTAIGEPDMTKYSYEESSGYYFDQKTGLYYDPKTQYYYHSQDKVYLYWHPEKKSYQLATNEAQSKDEGPKEDKTKAKKEDKEKTSDKVKVAKRIAKDMERWAKSQNQKKDFSKPSTAASQMTHLGGRSAATADIAFDVLERQEAGSFEVSRHEEPALVASYGGGSDSDDGPEESNDEQHHTDWVKMACLLCKRQFPTKEGLQRHNQLSDLHKQNLQMWYTSRGLEMPSQRAEDIGGNYRDRAQERRMKFGVSDAPKTNKMKEKYLKTQEPVYEEPTRGGIPSGNLGSKMLQKMGWSEGMGLGKSNQGRTDIVHAVQRVSSAGLGVAGSNLGSTATGASYKDNVKRAAMARFSEIQEREQEHY